MSSQNCLCLICEGLFLFIYKRASKKLRQRRLWSKSMAEEDKNNNEKVKKFGAHSVAPESSEDLNSKEVSENSEYSNAKGFKLLLSCAKKKRSFLMNRPIIFFKINNK